MDHEPNPQVRPPRHALLAGGGSGGHVYPGLAVAEALVAEGWVVTWMGRPGGMERQLVERSGTPYVAVPAAPLVGKGLVRKLRALVTLLVSGLRARGVLRKLGADVVVGTGGYVCAPAVLGARIARIPSLLIEPNAAPGAANRFLSRWASLATLAYPGSEETLACRAEVTGVPVREEFFHVPPTHSDSQLRLLVVGGSQGAAQINTLLPPAIEALAAAGRELEVVHQAGAAHAEGVTADYAARDLGGIPVRVQGYFEDLASAMGEADLVVSRAGAITLAELCASGRPSVLVPLRIAGGHQLDNARRLEEAGASVVLDGELDGGAGAEALAEVLGTLLEDSERRRRMSVAARDLAHEGAAQRIAELVSSLGEAA